MADFFLGDYRINTSETLNPNSTRLVTQWSASATVFRNGAAYPFIVLYNAAFGADASSAQSKVLAKAVQRIRKLEGGLQSSPRGREDDPNS